MEKRISSFHTRSSRKIGIQPDCKKCRTLQRRLNYQLNKNKEKLASRSYRKTHKTERNAWDKKQRITNPKFKISRLISANIHQSLKGNKNGRHWEDLVGYTLNALIKHLKKTMPSNYSWQDYINGKIDLHIDHKIPIKVHNFTTHNETDFLKCWALKNLQLMPAKENESKGATLETYFQPSLSGF